MKFNPNIILIKENKGLVKQQTSDISIIIANFFDPVYKEVFDKEADILQSKSTYVLFSMLKPEEQTQFIEALSSDDIVNAIEEKFHSTTIDQNTWPLATGEVSINLVLTIVRELCQSGKAFKFLNNSEPGKLLLLKIINHYLLGIGIIKHDLSVRVPVFIEKEDPDNDGIVMGLRRFLIELQYKNHLKSLNLRPAVLPKKPSTDKFGVPAFKFLISNYFVDLRRRLHTSFRTVILLNQVFAMIKAWWADSIIFEAHVSLPNFAKFKKIAKNYNLMKVALTSNYDLKYDYTDPISGKKYSIAIGVDSGEKVAGDFKAFSSYQILPPDVLEAIDNLAAVIENPPDSYKSLFVNELPTYFRHISIYNFTSNELLFREIKKAYHTPDLIVHSYTALSTAKHNDFKLYLKEFYSIPALEASHLRLITRLKSDITLSNIQKKIEKFYELAYDSKSMKAYEFTNSDVVQKELKVPLAIGVSQYVSFVGAARESKEIKLENFAFTDKDGVKNEIDIDSSMANFIKGIFDQKIFFLYEYIADVNFKTYPITSIDLTKSRMDSDGISETIDIDFLFSTISSLGFTGSSVFETERDTFAEILNTPFTMVLEDYSTTKSYYLNKNVNYSLQFFKYTDKVEVDTKNDLSVEALLNFMFGVNMLSQTWINNSYQQDFKDAISLIQTTYEDTLISNNSKYLIENLITDLYSKLASDPIIKNMLINLSLSSLPFNGNLFRSKEYIKFDIVYDVATFNFEQVTSALFEYYFDVKKDTILQLYAYVPPNSKRAAIINDYNDFAVKFVKEVQDTGSR